MTSFRRMFLASGMAILLLAIPFVVGAEGTDTHRIFFSEDDSAGNGGVADYAMIQLTDLESVAGRQNLDAETIRFLEANLWLPEPAAKPANVGGLDQIGLCQGEGLLAPGNRTWFVEAFGAISLYCSPRATYATNDSDVQPPTVDGRGERTRIY